MLQKLIQSMRGEIDDKQSQIDALMLEFCPERMTEEQIEEWERNQYPCSIEQYNRVCRNLGLPTRRG